MSESEPVEDIINFLVVHRIFKITDDKITFHEDYINHFQKSLNKIYLSKINYENTIELLRYATVLSLSTYFIKGYGVIRIKTLTPLVNAVLFYLNLFSEKMGIDIKEE